MNNKMRRLARFFAFAAIILFCWVIYPYKWIKRFLRAGNLSKAKASARALAKESGKAAFVVQDGDTFYVGSREQFRAKNTKIRKRLRDAHHDWMDWDYRNAIVYTAYPNGKTNDGLAGR